MPPRLVKKSRAQIEQTICACACACVLMCVCMCVLGSTAKSRDRPIVSLDKGGREEER